MGYLNQDWLANTTDTVPVFSALVEVTYRLFHWQPIFYGYYAVLMGIYLFSLFGIARVLFRIDQSELLSLFFVAVFFLIHSAGLRFSLSQLLSDNWTYVLEDGVADQRMLGTVFQPSAFGVLLALSIYWFLNRRHFLAIIAACLAAIFHPTYLLGAGCLTLAYMTILFQETRQIKLPLILGALALLLVSPILYQSYTIFGGTDTATVQEVRQILVNFRIPHHALVSQWFDATAVVKIIFILCALVVIRKTRLFLVLSLPFGVGVSLTIVQVLTQNNALALLFPWRVSIFLVPVSVTILLARFSNILIDWLAAQKWISGRGIRAISLVLISMAVISGASRFTLDLMRKNSIAEHEMFTHVSTHKQPGEVYLTPSKMQDFRLATGASVFIEFKSIPYQDTDVLEWYRRIVLNNRFYKDFDCSLLSSLIAEDGITQVVISQESQFLGCASISRQYQDPNFLIYRVNP